MRTISRTLIYQGIQSITAAASPPILLYARVISADALTKPIGPQPIVKLRDLTGMCDRSDWLRTRNDKELNPSFTKPFYVHEIFSIIQRVFYLKICVEAVVYYYKVVFYRIRYEGQFRIFYEPACWRINMYELVAVAFLSGAQLCREKSQQKKTNREDLNGSKRNVVFLRAHTHPLPDLHLLPLLPLPRLRAPPCPPHCPPPRRTGSARVRFRLGLRIWTFPPSAMSRPHAHSRCHT